MTDLDLNQYPDTVRWDFDGNEQRAKVFLDRYAMKGKDGRPVETRVDEMWSRVARGIAGDSQDIGEMPSEEAYAYYHILEDFKFVPGGRIMAGAGTGTEVTFYNCYVVPVETKTRRQVREAMAETGEPMENFDTDGDLGSDSREAIIDTVGLMVDILSRGGGVGVNWSVLRPAGAYLKRLNGTSSGPIDWMHFASTAVGTVEQGGSRRGAAMFMLDDWHPDVLDFISSKRDLTRITNANISVAVSDAFMSAVDNDADWPLVFPETSHPAYDAEWDGNIDAWQDKGYPVKSYGVIPSRLMWRKLAEAAWDNGEPGVVFLDRYNKQSTGASVERLISVNPCGEQGLGAYSVCNLGAMNLAKYVSPDADGALWQDFDSTGFEQDVATAVRFLDKVIDQNYYFLPENERVQKELRRIGLSVMGLADALVMLGLRYGSPEAVAFTEMVFRSMKDVAIETSAALARELGAAPAWDNAMWETPYLKDYINRHGSAGLGQPDLRYPALRNLFLLTQAPTGTTSILAGVNSGIEPFFALGYWREDRTGRHWVEPKVIADIKAGWVEATGQHENDLPEMGFIVTAGDVSVEEHIAMQAAVQKYVDSSVSKTINAPNSHTIDEVEKAYTLAYASGLKGLAYFRDGCGRAQVLSTENAELASMTDEQFEAVDAKIAGLQLEVDRKEDVILKLLAREPKEFVRPESLTGRTHKVRSAIGNIYVTVNRDASNEPVEVFVNAGKAGSEVMAMGEAMGRLMSIGLQNDLTLDDLGEQLSGVGNTGPFNRSLPAAIAEALNADIAAQGKVTTYGEVVLAQNPVAYWRLGEVDGLTNDDAFGQPANEVIAEAAGLPEAPAVGLDLCPECSSLSLQRTEGCQTCMSCGYSAC